MDSQHSGDRRSTDDDAARRVLVVDDDVDFADSLGDSLEARGYAVATANDARQAIQATTTFDPEVALVDLRLGAGCGLDTVRALKECRPGLICVMITGDADVDSAIRALRSGLDDYLQKPVGPSALFAVLDRCFEKLRLEETVRRKEEELKRLALTDPLTGLPNRRYFQQRFAHEVGRAKRYGNELCIAICDIDRFKAVNDAIGHDGGDEVLTAFAGHLRENVRDVDLVARWGGEEFVLLLPETALGGAVEVLDRIRTEFSKRDWPRLGRPVTASFGVTRFHPSESGSSALARADAALYESKESGRNKVTARNPPEGPAESWGQRAERASPGARDLS